jgi:hypothetical protein
VTTDRAPFGGWFAQDDAGKPIKGALLVSARYERDVALSAITRSGLRRLRGGVRADPSFSALYAFALAGLLGSAAWLAFGGRRWARDGR